MSQRQLTRRRVARAKAVNKALSADKCDLAELRELSLSGAGFLTAALRKQAWARLVGASPACTNTMQGVSVEHAQQHQVHLDVIRSLWKYPKNISDSARHELRSELENMINAILATYPDLSYYQGFHDILSVLLLTCGSDVAFAVAKRLVRCHIYEYMQEDLKPVIARLWLIFPLLSRYDPELLRRLKEADIEPHYAISWVLTWFAHDVDSLEDLARLYDILLWQHPLFIIYMCAAVTMQHRVAILAAECEFSCVYKVLSSIHAFDLDAAVASSCAMMRELPPRKLRLTSRGVPKKDAVLLAASTVDAQHAELTALAERNAAMTSRDDVFYDLISIPRRGHWLQRALTLGMLAAGTVLLAQELDPFSFN